MTTAQIPPVTRPIKSRGLAYSWAALFFALVVTQLTLAPASPTFWQYWEIGSLVTAVVFSSVFYVRLFYRGLYQGLPKQHVGNVVLALLFALGSMVCATLVAWGRWRPQVVTWWDATSNPSVVTLTFLSCGMLGFCIIDRIFSGNHPDKDVTAEFTMGFWFNGVPVLLSFLVLLFFAALFPVTAANHDHLKSFVGGAVAFEMLTGNTVFVVLFWKPLDI